MLDVEKQSDACKPKQESKDHQARQHQDRPSVVAAAQRVVPGRSGCPMQESSGRRRTFLTFAVLKYPAGPSFQRGEAARNSGKTGRPRVEGGWTPCRTASTTIELVRADDECPNPNHRGQSSKGAAVVEEFLARFP
jgi:hypothetical protein